MKNILKKIQRKTENIKRFGIIYEWDNLLLKFGFIKNRSLKSIQEIENFFRALKKEQYPEYLKEWYQKESGRELNLDNPTRFTEKIQWLKLYDSTSIKTKLADKYLVRDWVAEKIGEDHLIPLLGVWDSFDEIDFDTLPNQFVLKCTHDSGGLVICKDKSQLDLKKTEEKINRCLNSNYYWHGREWPYKNVKPRIIAEQYMVDESGVELKDYKIFNFGGEPKLIQVDFNRFVKHTKNIYDTEWNYLNVAINYPTDPTVNIKKPECLEKMLEMAKELSAGLPFLRTDFYVINGKIYFGELTFSPGSGFMKMTPESFDLEMGSWIPLPDKK